MLFKRFNKKNHYKNKIKLTYQRIWDLEFLTKEMQDMREQIRKAYDRLSQEVAILTQHKDLIKAFGMEKASELTAKGPEYAAKELENHKEEHALTKEEQDAVDNVSKRIEEKNIDIEYKKSQMKAIDTQLEESWKASGDGGIFSAIEGYRSVISILKKEIKKL